MMKRLVTGTLLALTAVAAQAEHQDSGWLVGAAAVFGDYSLDNELVDDTDTGLQLTAQYRFNRWFGIEGAYLNFGEFEEDGEPQDPSAGNAKVQVDGFSISAVGYVPLGSEDFDLYGKAGFYNVDQLLELQGRDSSKRSAEGLTAGLGARIAVAEHFGIRLEGNWYDLEDADFWAVNLGVDYHFGK